MQVNLENKKVEINYGLKFSNDSRVECSIFHKLVSMTIGGIVFPGVLIQFNSSDVHVMLEMKWLYTYGVKIGCDDPQVISRKWSKRGKTLSFKFCYESE